MRTAFRQLQRADDKRRCGSCLPARQAQPVYRSARKNRPDSTRTKVVYWLDVLWIHSQL